MASSSGYVTEGFTNPPNYSFPHEHLERVMKDKNRTPVVLVACGSFSPVTYLHLRMFEMARDYIRHNTEFEIVGAYLSPVSDQYKKPGLLSAHHRVAMCKLAAEESGTGLMVDSWEAFQSYQRTAIVLDHFDYEINTVLGGVQTEDGEHRPVRVMLLAGSDLISTMSEPGVWSYSDLDHILGRYGVFIIERAGSGMDQATDALAKWRHNIYLISQLIQNDVSSTKVRLFLRRGLSVRYLLPNSVVDYIERNGLYLDEGAGQSPNPPSNSDKGKEKEPVTKKDSQQPSSSPPPPTTASAGC
ncbi:nicotinamide mononucleotide adenylyl transferase [Ephemerocybe angulata]|uniref:Nicotinamide-nucleotide adenylyltransferase n=1 Tax=Ephemerocybe angulata TaxID=980116 RepID=A0A8H6MFA8_9AGAR|nr:nicotinamide mononucleotide adenylyl transferase [Tulosesus angulatus]